MCLRAAYDDGGFSGATMDRPALQQQLGDLTLGATRQTSMRVNEPSSTGHLAIAVSQATPLASAKGTSRPREMLMGLPSARSSAFCDKPDDD